MNKKEIKTVHPRDSVINISQDQSNEQHEKKRRLSSLPIKCCISHETFFYGILVGMLSSGVILATISALWLTSHNTNITTTTTTATAKTATSTTTNVCGIPISVGHSNKIYSVSNGSTTYSCNYYQWTPVSTGLVTLAFTLQNDPDQWNLDDVSVSNGTNEILLNGGFETGSLSPWTTSSLNGSCNITGSGAQISNSGCHTGNYCIVDGCGGHADQISQSFMAIAGEIYFISFWLKQGGDRAVISASVTLD